MKILCLEHNGPIDVPDKDITDTFRRNLSVLVIHCPVCEEEVLIRNIQMDDQPQLNSPYAN